MRSSSAIASATTLSLNRPAQAATMCCSILIVRDSGRELSDFRHYRGQPPGDGAFPLGENVRQLPVVPEGIGFARRETVENEGWPGFMKNSPKIGLLF